MSLRGDANFITNLFAADEVIQALLTEATHVLPRPAVGVGGVADLRRVSD